MEGRRPCLAGRWATPEWSRINPFFDLKHCSKSGLEHIWSIARISSQSNLVFHEGCLHWIICITEDSYHDKPCVSHWLIDHSARWCGLPRAIMVCYLHWLSVGCHLLSLWLSITRGLLILEKWVLEEIFALAQLGNQQAKWTCPAGFWTCPGQLGSTFVRPWSIIYHDLGFL